MPTEFTRKETLVLVAVVAGIAALLIVFLIEWPQTPAAWVTTPPNGKAPVEALALVIAPLGAVGTLIGVGFTVYFASHNLRQAQRTERATRFQKGAEMLASSSTSTATAGVQLLTDLAVEDDATYQDPVVRTLRQRIQETYLTLIEATYRGETPASNLPRSGGLVSSAIGGIARIPRGRRWRRVIDEEGRLSIWGLYLHKSRLLDVDMYRMNIVGGVIGSSVFARCRLDETRLQFRLAEQVTFRRCTLSNCQLQVRRLNGAKISEPFSKVVFEDCDVENVTINEVRIPDRHDLTSANGDSQLE